MRRKKALEPSFSPDSTDHREMGEHIQMSFPDDAMSSTLPSFAPLPYELHLVLSLAFESKVSANLVRGFVELLGIE